MKLYHFTRSIHLAGIAERGLVPRGNRLLTFGIPVVWFTANPGAPEWLIKFHADAVRVTVDVKKQKLLHWLTWFEHLESDGVGSDGVERHVTGREVLASIRNDPTSGESFTHDAHDFYVHLGIVHRKRIKLTERIKWQEPDTRTGELLAKHQATLSEQAV